MPHAIWRGSISFGLVTIPVTLFPAENTSARLSFNLLDQRDLSPVRQKRVNASTGEEVAWEDVVKGYELEPGRWVVLTDDDFRAADVEATQTIDVLAAVCADTIDPTYFDKPYYLEPSKSGRKAYALLRETLRRAERVALCRIVIRTREHLAALVPHGEALVLEIIRFPYEIRGTEGLELPGQDLEAAGITSAELDMAAQLVQTIAKEFDPDDYHDSYHEKLLALIEKKAAGGEIAAPPEAVEGERGEVVDIMAMLKASLEEAKRDRA